MRSLGLSAASITVLLLVSVITPLMTVPEQLWTSEVHPASGRSSTEEVFLSTGGGANGNEFPTSITATASGFAVLGDYNRTVNFGTHSLTPTSPFSNGNEFFVAHMDASGAWTAALGADHSTGGVSFAADLTASQGAAVVTGYMYGPGVFGSTTLQTSVLDGFVAKANANGNGWAWAKAFQTVANQSSDNSVPNAVAVDANGDVIVAGTFSGETDFGGTSINVSNTEVFVAKLDGGSGNLVWAVSGGGLGDQGVTDVVVDGNGNIQVSGITQTAVYFGANSYTPVGTQDSFVLTLSSTGSFLSVDGYGVANEVVVIRNLAMDANNQLFIGGTFSGTLTKSGWSITANKGGSDIFIVKQGATPSQQWATIGGSNANDELTGMAVDSRGEVVFSAYIQGTFSAGTKAITPSGNFDGLVGGLSATGSWTWLDVTRSPDYEAHYDVAINSNDIAAVVGAYANQNPAQISKGTTTITAAGAWDTFVWAFDPAMKKDSDTDGVPDVSDNCPTVSNPLQENTDLDLQGDACDADDDNDGITDNSGDDCPRNGQFNWTSTQDFAVPDNSSDWDRDGCKDDAEDNDIDNDGVLNTNDVCPRSPYQPPRPTWESNASTDIDGDGCRDVDEDVNDDGDTFDDVFDDCPSVFGNSTQGQTGCPDNDGDGWSNALDDCPDEAGNSTLGGKNACFDQDGDGWANVDDAFVDDPSQWADADGDGFGDNPSGTTADACPDVAGDSSTDRIGCLDTDGDGVSDSDDDWSTEDGADAFPEDATQWSDFDGDGLGDNWANASWDDRNPSWPGVYHPDVTAQDACPTQAGTATANGMTGCPDADGDGWYNLQDAFPGEASQWADEDADGFGDNPAGVEPDACPLEAGTSNMDRFGCIDNDGDGYSAPVPDWTPWENGADYDDTDATQWANTDRDAYGDNPNGDQPDECPEVFGTSSIDRLGCLDSDADGLSDATDAWNLEDGADACPLAYGNSTADRIGCLDSDGDGYSDPTGGWDIEQGADAYPNDPNRWIYEPPSDDLAFASTEVVVGGGVGVVFILALLGLLVRRRGRADVPLTKAPVMLPDFTAQPMTYATPPTAAPAYVGAPVATPPANVPPPPGFEPDPAREYYNGLIAQGYPPQEAMQYTQQYYNHFRG